MRFFLFTLMLISFFAAFAQQADTLNLNDVTEGDCYKAREDFETKLTKWFHKSYSPKMNVKISCGGCYRLSIVVAFAVDENGKTSNATVIKSDFCGQELSAKQKAAFAAGVTKLKPDACLKGKVVRYTFSRVLKC